MREMRRSDRKLGQEDALRVLKDGEYGILATANLQGQPYGVPLSYIVKDNAIYVHGTNEGSSKYDNILENNKVSFTVVGKTQVLHDTFTTNYESAIAFGEAAAVEDEEEKLMAYREFIQKYSADYPEAGEKYIEAMGNKTLIIKISITNLTGKRRK
ncbi:MAG: pyridoxamine 5'-phosphate oxidase family protein [Anaerovoracaceae bacterium]|jgi:nitroimidazol reductase NimA-like FMN-containing flavoprotein (pyridoxamine 5'-phosphate oxidase superfamily)